MLVCHSLWVYRAPALHVVLSGRYMLVCHGLGGAESVLYAPTRSTTRRRSTACVPWILQSKPR
eukprot:2054409-Rhodomonas_salina.1